MAYQTTYRLSAVNQEGQTVIIHVSDTTSPVGTPVFEDLTLISATLSIENPGSGKHSIINGTNLDFSFLSTSTYRLGTFKGENDKFLVEVYFLSDATQPIFKGFLVTDEGRESFVQKPGIYEISLAATDNLAILKETPLTMPDGTNPRGYYKPIEYIAWALQKTHLQLSINTIDGICEENVNDPTVDGNWYNHTYVWSKSLEKDINLSVDCYEALEQMLKGRRLFQWWGEWYILRTDEMNGGPYLIYKYDYDGTFDTAILPAPATKIIGPSQEIKLIDRSGEVMPERPHKFDQLEKKFEYPIEIIDNIDFGRLGNSLAIAPDLSLYQKTFANLGAFPSTGEFEWVYQATDTGNFYRWNGTGYTLLTGAEIPAATAYEHPDWTLFRIPSGTITIQSYIAKIVQAGVERERYLVIPGGANFHGVASNPIPVHVNDKLVFSFDRRLISNQGGSGQVTDLAAQLRLYGDDGSFWTVTNQPATGVVPGQWIQSTSIFANGYVEARWNKGQTDEREWMAISVDTRPLPVSGKIVVVLNMSSVFGPSGVEAHFQNLQLEYIPFIKGSYSKFTGQYHKVSQPDTLSANIVEEAGVTDLPKRLFKGALHKLVGTEYILTERFFNYNASTSGELGIAPFGKYLAFDYWNQHWREFRTVQDNLLGLNSLSAPTNPPGLLHTYQFDFTDIHASDKEYMLLSFSQDLMNCKWQGTFAEVFDHTQPKFWTWPHEFDMKHDT